MSAATPEGVTAAVRRVNLFGAPGQEAADRERRHLELEQSRVSRTIAALAAQFLQAEKIDISPLTGILVGSQTSCTTKTGVAGGHLSLSSTAPMKRIEDLATLILPVGLHSRKFDPGIAGPLRELQTGLKAFHAFADGFSASDEILCGYYARATAAAKHAIVAATRLLNDIDIPISNLRVLLAEWQSRREQIRSTTNELAWLLDGWGTVFDFAGLSLYALMSDSIVIHKLTALIPSVPGTGSSWGRCIDPIGSVLDNACICHEVGLRLRKG
jgi:hypothetical protein